MGCMVVHDQDGAFHLHVCRQDLEELLHILRVGGAPYYVVELAVTGNTSNERQSLPTSGRDGHVVLLTPLPKHFPWPVPALEARLIDVDDLLLLHQQPEHLHYELPPLLGQVLF